MNKSSLIKYLNLAEHIEGGYFARTYQSPTEYDNRALMTSIYYLLTDERPIGRFHKNRSDIMHYFHLGAPMTYLTISPTGDLEQFILGPDLAAGHHLQKLVKGGYWKASFLASGEFGLLSEAVAPGFDYADMEIGEQGLLQKQFPELWPKIAAYVI